MYIYIYIYIYYYNIYNSTTEHKSRETLEK